MRDAELKKVVQSVGFTCAAIGDGTPQPAARGLAFVLAMLLKTPEQVQKIAEAAKAIIQKKGEMDEAAL